MNFFRWKQHKDEDLNTEIQTHLDEAIRERMERGESAEQARLNAQREFGNVGLVKEVTREMWGWTARERWWQDLRFGVRMLRKNPSFTLIAVLTLALGIGANTAIFSVVNALVFNPLPYPEPEQLVWVTNDFRGDEIIGSDVFLAFQAQSQSFAHLAAFGTGVANLPGEAEPLHVVRGTASLFPTLGVTPRLGRAFTADEDRPGALHVIVLSHEYWLRRFGGNPAAIGQSLLLGKEQWTVIGVLPPGFRFLPERRLGGRVDVWMPLALDTPKESAGTEGTMILENAIGRLKPGVSVEQAQAEFETILRGIAQTYPQMPPDHKASVTPLAERLVGHLRRALLVLFGAVGFVLFIACANVANLLLARASVRQKELAIRAAVGASRKRLIRQMLTESLMLSLLGGGAGLLLAHWGVRALVAFTPEDLLQLKLSRIDTTVLAFTFCATLLTGVVAGLIPALQASRVDLNESLKDGARTASFLQRRSARRISPALVIGELALTLVLLIGAGLLIKSFQRLRAVDPGYNPQHLLTAVIPLDYEQYPQDSTRQNPVHRDLLTRISALPGVQAVGIGGTLPMIDSGINGKERLTVVGGPPVPTEQRPTAELHEVSPDYFRALAMPLRAGRGFTEQDTEHTPLVVVINETLSRRLFAGADPIGQRIRNEYLKADLTVVGVVADVKRYGLAAETQAEMYRSYFQNRSFPTVIFLAVRAAGDPSLLVPALRQQVREMDAEQPIFDVMPMEQRLTASVAPRRFQMWLFGLFAAVALALAAIGVYGVISYSVSHRTHEIGIRMALGAKARDVMWLVVRQGMACALVGIAVGLMAAYGLTRLMKTLLFNVTATDPTTFVAISCLLIGIALLAAWLPARRATKVDPLIALRHE